MTGITEKAGRQLAHELESAQVLDAQLFRFCVEQDQARLKLDEEKPGDKVFRHEDHKVLAVDPETAKRVAERKLDYDESRSHYCFV